MRNLNFIVDWEGNPEKAWSGTKNSLYRGLSNYFRIKVIEEKPLKTWSLKERFKYYFPKYRPLYTDYIKQNRRYINSKKENESEVFLQFSEFVKDQANRKTFIYQDLVVAYLEDMKKNEPEIFNYSGFSGYSNYALSKRSELQLDYYDSASGIFVMGRWLKEWLDSRYPELRNKVHHVGGGVNLNFDSIDSGVKKGNNKILFVGRDYVRKGGPEVIAAFELLRKRNSKLELHFAGPSLNPVGYDLPGYYFYGDASKQQVQTLMNTCDVFCMPSNFEAYGLVFIEALCFGLPCIGRNAYEMPYFIEEGKTGELLKSGSVEELASLINKVLLNTSYKANVSQNRERYIAEYSWDNVCKKMADIISMSCDN